MRARRDLHAMNPTAGIVTVNNWTIYCQQLYNPEDKPAMPLVRWRPLPPSKEDLLCRTSPECQGACS